MLNLNLLMQENSSYQGNRPGQMAKKDYSHDPKDFFNVSYPDIYSYIFHEYISYTFHLQVSGGLHWVCVQLSEDLGTTGLQDKS